jgi:hypothetical protein
MFSQWKGADPTLKSRMLFARAKGEAENALSDLNFQQLHIFRPGYIHPSVPRTHPNFSYRIFAALYPIMNFFDPKLSIKSDELSRAMFEIGLNGVDKKVYQNVDIRNYLNLDK